MNHYAGNFAIHRFCTGQSRFITSKVVYRESERLKVFPLTIPSTVLYTVKQTFAFQRTVPRIACNLLIVCLNIISKKTITEYGNTLRRPNYQNL